jgi:hypothetical protein
MAKDKSGHGSEKRGVGAAHQSMVRKVLATGNVGAAMAHSVTGFDRQQQARASGPGKLGNSYYNPYALPQYLGAAHEAAQKVAGGMSHADAINEHFTGQLANRLHRDLQTGGKAVR